MPRLKVLSGKDLVKIFSEFGFTIQSQKGSHIKLSKLLQDQKQTLVIPNHSEMDVGTIKAIYR